MPMPVAEATPGLRAEDVTLGGDGASSRPHSSSAVKPALTAMADAVRIGDNLLESGASAAAASNGRLELAVQETP